MDKSKDTPLTITLPQDQWWRISIALNTTIDDLRAAEQTDEWSYAAHDFLGSLMASQEIIKAEIAAAAVQS